MMIASAFCWTAALMNEICDDADASVGPVILFVPPSSFIASSMPECSNSSYGLPSCFGIETVLRPVFEGRVRIGARLRGEDSDCDAPLPLDAWSSLVSPHAATNAVAATSTSAASTRRYRVIHDPSSLV